MPVKVVKYSVFVASLSDVKEERLAVDDVIKEKVIDTYSGPDPRYHPCYTLPVVKKFGFKPYLLKEASFGQFLSKGAHND